MGGEAASIPGGGVLSTQKGFLCVFICDLLVRNREWSEPLMLMHNDFGVVAFWLFWLEYNMEVETPY
jgi:hypothetical protein